MQQLHQNDVVAKSVNSPPLYPAIGFSAVYQPRPMGLEGGLQQQHSVACHPTQVNVPHLNPSGYSICLPQGEEG